MLPISKPGAGRNSLPLSIHESSIHLTKERRGGAGGRRRGDRGKTRRTGGGGAVAERRGAATAGSPVRLGIRTTPQAPWQGGLGQKEREYA